jgi:hypothetical protein
MRDREVETQKKDKGTDKQVLANAHRREKTKHAKAFSSLLPIRWRHRLMHLFQKI